MRNTFEERMGDEVRKVIGVMLHCNVKRWCRSLDVQHPKAQWLNPVTLL